MRRRLCILGLLFCTASELAAAPERTLPFSSAEVTCTARQLARAQRRMTSVGAGQYTLSLGTNALWTASRAAGRFAGLVRLRNAGGNGYNDFIAGQEHFAEADLAFDLLFRPSVSLLDPRLQRAPQATLVRRDLGTNLVVDHVVENPGGNHGCCIAVEPECSFDLSCPMILNFDLAAVPGDSVNPLVPLVINSAAAAAPEFTGPLSSFLPSASGTGPGIEADLLDQSCGGRLTEFDGHVFEILARTIVPSGCYSLGPSNCKNQGVNFEAYNLAIFRGTDPHVYRVDVYVVEYLCDNNDHCYFTAGPVALQFLVNWDEQGRLTTGDVKVLPVCRADQTTDCSDPQVIKDFGLGIFLVPPIFPGHEEEKPAAFHGAPYLNVTSDRSQQVLHANINWKALLKKTALNQP